MDEKKVLAYNPFEDDFGDPGDRCFRDKMVYAKKTRPCHICTADIMPGERIRTSVHLFDGVVRTYSWCNKCCQAMERVWDFQGDPFEERMKVRNEKG